MDVSRDCAQMGARGRRTVTDGPGHPRLRLLPRLGVTALGSSRTICRLLLPDTQVTAFRLAE